MTQITVKPTSEIPPEALQIFVHNLTVVYDSWIWSDDELCALVCRSMAAELPQVTDLVILIEDDPPREIHFRHSDGGERFAKLSHASQTAS